ncbi:MAG: GldG family protein [Leptospiraceae bacterium]|nr:GldG family protein [Leptospiraceae bacterium]
MSFIHNLNRPALVYTNVVLLFFLLNGVLAKSNWGLDLSRDQRNSLSESTSKVLSQLDSPVLVEAYISRDLPGGMMAYIDPFLSTLRSIRSEGGDKIELRIINPLLPEEVKRASERGIQGIALTQQRDIEVTSRQFFFGVYLQYGEESRVIQLVDPEGRIIPNLEYEFLREVRAMLRKDQSSGIAFVRAEGALRTAQPQRGQGYDKDNMWGFRTLLERDAGQIDEISLEDAVKPSVDTLLLAGLPRMSDLEVYHLDQFLMRGGNLVFLTQGMQFAMQTGGGNPYMQQFGGGQSMGFSSVPAQDLERVNQWLGKYGLHINSGFLVDPPEQGLVQINDPLNRTPIPQAYAAWSYYSRDAGNILGQQKVIEFTRELIVPWPSGLDVREAAQSAGKVEYQTLIQSNPSAIQVENQNLDFNSVMDLVKDPTRDRVGHPIPIAVLASGKFTSGFHKDGLPEGVAAADFKPAQVGDSRSQILLIGSSWLVSDILLTGQINFQLFGINRSFVQNTLEAMQGDDELLAIRSRVPSLAILEMENPIWVILFTLVHIFTIPGLLAVYGTMRLIRRNRKQGIVVDAPVSTGGES